MAQKYITLGHPKYFVLRVCEVSSSTWYDRKKVQQVEEKLKIKSKGRPVPGHTLNPDGTYVLDSSVVAALNSYRARPEFMNGGGYHKLKFYLQRDFKYFINHKKLYRLCKENKLLLPRNRKKRKKNKKICVNRVIYRPNQLWEFDIKYGYVHGENRHFYILSFIDVFNRKLVNYHVGLFCKATDLKFTFEEALKKEGIKIDSDLTIRSDNGPQMTSVMFEKFIRENSIDHEFIPPGDCNKNAHVESFNGILDTEFFQVRYFDTFEEAYSQTIDFMSFYNEERLHGSLKMLPPIEFTKKFERSEVQIKDLIL